MVEVVWPASGGVRNGPGCRRESERGDPSFSCRGGAAGMALWPPRSPDLRPSREEELQPPDSQIYNEGIEMACQQQKKFVKSSVECKWNLAEAQQKLGSLALHNSESLDQEHAKAQAAAAELRYSEEEWRRKEEVLRQRERQDLWNIDFISKEVFNKSFINQKERKETEEDASESFIQKHEQKIRHFGMLSRWFDSQRFLSEHPYLVCEETAKYLLLWCFHLEAEQKGALMEQVAHQAVVMQFIIEMAKSCNVDPRGCFRLFFQRATNFGELYRDIHMSKQILPEFSEKVNKLVYNGDPLDMYLNFQKTFDKMGEEGYLEAFKNELEAFKSRVRICSHSQNFQAMSVQNPFVHTSLNSIGGFASFPQNAELLQGCSGNSVVHRDEEEPKMMDTV